MCMIAAVAVGPLGILATDTRWSFLGDGGRWRRLDAGQKLHHVGGGWIAATGSAPVANVAYEAVRDAADIADTQLRIDAAYRRYGPVIRQLWRADDGWTQWVLMSAGGRAEVHNLYTAGEGVAYIEGGGPQSILVTWPPELGGDAERLRAAFDSRIRAAATPGAMLHVVAAAFAECSQGAETMSSALEIGIALASPGGPGTPPLHRRLFYPSAAAACAMGPRGLDVAFLAACMASPAQQGGSTHDAEHAVLHDSWRAHTDRLIRSQMTG